MLKELEGLNEQELKVAQDILKQLAEGNTQKLHDLAYADYAEIPVDIETFIHEKQYLGNALYDKEGRYTLFPYWEQKLKEIFPTNTTTAYNTIILTGAIGLGKSSISVICLLYMLYRLLCLKDPYVFYGLQPVDKITVSFLNISIENARGVGGDKFNQMILSSPWFMAHGTMTGETNLSYKPKAHIEIVYGSSNNQIMGRAIFCLDGETTISTSEGDAKLKDLQGKQIQVYTINERGEKTLSDPCYVQPTVRTEQAYQIELEDGTILKCTENHQFMLKDGTYREAKYLTEQDELW